MAAAADTSSGMCLLGAMDSLWFQQIILLPSQHYPLFLPNGTCETEVPLSVSETSSDASSRISSQMSVISPQESSSLTSDESSSQESENEEEETRRQDERPSQAFLVSSKTRGHSSSPISEKHQSRKLQYSSYYYTRKLLKTRSSKSLTDLELEEVKGFMDLGFTFPKGNFNNRLMKLLPGLQRIDAYKLEEKNSKNISEFTKNTQNSEDEESIAAIRPYLSEAWFRKRRDSPLLGLRVPRSATASAADMKQQLKDWARTVALMIQQER